MLKGDFRISLGPAFILGELFWTLYPSWCLHDLLTSSFSASSLDPLFRETDCFWTLWDALLVGEWFSGAQTVASEVVQALGGAALDRRPRN